ncbi:hypothetical protein C2S52_001220, partial [Perilla frutescens var. hirtella]
IDNPRSIHFSSKLPRDEDDNRLDPMDRHISFQAEKKWKLAQNNMESSSSSLVSAANDLSVASINSKCASGDVFPLKIISDATNFVN